MANENTQQVRNIVEAALFAAGEPLSVDRLLALFEEDERPEKKLMQEVLQGLQQECEGRGIELKEVSSGYRYQARSDVSRWISRLWEERAPRYSRALLETLALVAYRQPITRAEIEDIRGVVVSSSIMKTLLERGWVRIVGHRDVPGKPAMYASTREFLDYFNLQSLDDLPTLAELRDIDKINAELDLRLPGESRQEQLAANDISADPLALAALITADFEPVEYV
jgi:segregation and condensation protein B